MANWILNESERIAMRERSYVGITIREPGSNMSVQAVNGRCTRCPNRMPWIVIRGRIQSAPNPALTARDNSVGNSTISPRLRP